ncbi:unnamed protein product [Phyllotreta striolata]|uniref:Uncharacterized protein n=1 Tax=Phyllotreta striolata TaxID=444603 RepID=A0A9P0GXR2_PHYSR|nr:unnamed protein product [Phyllotreta striolata]
MPITKLHLLVLAQLASHSLAQNARSYDTNDWVPVTQTAGDPGAPKNPTGRVLNIDAPAQKFFPDEFNYKKPRPRPKHKERPDDAYKFEVPPSLPQNVPPAMKLLYQFPPPPLDIYHPPPPPGDYPQAQALRAPYQHQAGAYQQYQLQQEPSIPSVSAYNTSFYQTINPLSINQELVGGVRYQAVPEKLRNSEKINGGKDSVQLVYVPLENLKENQQVPVPQDTQNIYRQVDSPRYDQPNPHQKPHNLAAIEQDFIQQALQATKLQEQIQQGEPLYFQITTTTPKPVNKRKPHQPPLAVYLEGEKQRADITDVLSALQEAKSIAVQDSIQPNSPEIFIGPSTLDSSDYSKFPLPYLNSIDGQRISKNIENLPFFVAPQNFKTPPGFSKIPLPAPHVGSVVVSIKDDLHGKRSTPRPNQFLSDNSKQLGRDNSVSEYQKSETLTPQPYFGQTYYDRGAYLTSPQPELVELDVNGQTKQYLPEVNYNREIYNNAYNNQRLEASKNREVQPQTSFQYNYDDRNIKPEANRDLNYNSPASLSYTGPQTYQGDDKQPNRNVFTDVSNQQNAYRLKNIQPVVYEPISTTFNAASRPTYEAKIKPETTTKAYNGDNQQTPKAPDVSPLELAINEFELHQINAQLEEKPRIRNQNYKTQNSDDGEYKFDPELHRFSSTPSSILRDTYETTARPTVGSRTRIRNRPKTTTQPSSDESEETYTILEDFSIKQRPQNNQQELTQTETPARQAYKNPNYNSDVTEIENIPTKVYSLNINKNSPEYTEEAPSTEHPYTLNQMDQQVLKQIEQQGQFEVTPQHHPIYSNQQSNDYPQSQSEENPNEYSSSLDDPSIRALLVPLVPTTTNADVYTGPSYLPTTETIKHSTTSTTTERAVPETTTQSRVRSRTRGGGRFSTQSTTKRSVSRRRPASRVTTERPSRYSYSQDDDYTTRSSVIKSRFRTRVRTTPSTIPQQSTEVNEVHQIPTSETRLRTHPESADSDKVVTVKPEEQVYSVSKEYPTSTRPFIQYDNTASTSKPNINVQITHPDDVPKERTRVRSRVKDRPRTSSTERVVTRRIIEKTPPAKEDSEEEFYGFFRRPDFGPSSETTVDVPSTTPRHRIYSYQTPSQHGEDYQLNVDNTRVESTTVRFIGEIVPKYTTSREIAAETETPKPRIRTRTRTPQRKTQSEPTTRRSNVIRSRGKTHFKLPETAKKIKEDEDAEVEGGNYPAQFLQGRRTSSTPTPNFQITVSPEDEDDQVIHSSLYRPNVIARPQEWHDASEYPDNNKKTNSNSLDNDEDKSKLTDDQQDQPYALPVHSVTEEVVETTPAGTSEELFKETTKRIAEQFEAVNNFETETESEFETEKPAKQKKKKGVWKLVKHRPVDRLETSESQNYFSVLNAFYDIQKVDGNKGEFEEVVDEIKQSAGEQALDKNRVNEKEEYNEADELETTTFAPEEAPVTTINDNEITTIVTSTIKSEKDEDFLDSIYEMFGMSRTEEKTTIPPIQETETSPPVTTTLNPTFPQEIDDSQAANSTEAPAEITTILEDFSTTQQAKNDVKASISEVEPWKMREIRTSTSTEVSHETEICYRGRCVKSHGRKKRL